jgi:hypothetical protein
MTSINKLVQRIERYLPQRNNRFEARLFLPNGNQIIPDNVLPVVGFQTPEKNIIMKEYSYYGVNRKIPYKRQFGDLSITFLADEKGILQSSIETWMDTLVNPFTDTLNDRNNIFQGRIELRELGTEEGEPEHVKYIFYEALPKSILPFNFSSEQKNEHLTFTVLFTFKQYEFIAGAYSTRPSGQIQI